MKRKFFTLALIIAAVFIGACSKEGNTEVKSRIKLIYKKGYTQWIEDTIKDYEKLHPERKVDLQIVGGTDADYYTKLSLLLQTDSSVDVIFEDSFLLNSMASSKLLAPINEMTKWQDWTQFYPAFRESATINGNLYGVPISTDVRGLFYNKKIFERHGFRVPWQPKNWNDLIETAKQLKVEKRNVIPFSMNVAAYGEQTAMQTFEMLLYGTGSSLYKDGKWVVKSKGILDSLNFIAKIFKDNLGPNLSIALNKQYPIMIFESIAVNEDVAIFLDGCWGMNFWQRMHPQTLNLYGFVPMPTQFGQEPGFISMSGGWLFSISSKTKNKEASLDFIKFASSKENYLKYSKIAFELTPRKDVIESPEFPEILKRFASFMEFTHFRPANAQYPIVSNYIQKMVESVATQNLTQEQAMNEFAENVKRTLGGSAVIEEENKLK